MFVLHFLQNHAFTLGCFWILLVSLVIEYFLGLFDFRKRLKKSTRFKDPGSGHHQKPWDILDFIKRNRNYEPSDSMNMFRLARFL